MPPPSAVPFLATAEFPVTLERIMVSELLARIAPPAAPLRSFPVARLPLSVEPRTERGPPL